MPVRNYPFNQFRYGLITRDPIQTIPDGAAGDSLNWITKKGGKDDTGGKIELVRGYAPLGTELAGLDRVSGLIVGKKADNTQIPFMSTGKKVKYYDSVLMDWVEIGSDILGTAADGEDITFARFDSRAGKQVWLNSPRSGPKKIMVANPGDYTDLYDASVNYKAWLSIKNNLIFNWNISNSDRNVVRTSYIETRSVTDYTQIVAEVVGTGNGVNTTFAGTLAFKGVQSKRTALDVSFTDGVETFSDNLNGTLTGNLGGTGTINYTTGAFSITFNTAVTNLTNVTATYRWVDETAANGMAKFVVPVSRVSGDPNVFRQDTGGDVKNIFSLKEHRFVAHTESIYDLVFTLDDTSTTNNLYRENQGIPSLRGGVESPEGVYTIDFSEKNNPRFVVIGYNNYSTEIKPTDISENLELSGYLFDYLDVGIFDDYVFYACQTADSPQNNRTFVYHRVFKTWDILDYCISSHDIYNGTLIAGDSISKNVFTLFSGTDADGTPIYNYWKSGITNMGTKYLKKIKKVSLEGEIGPNQVLHMYVSLDRGQWVEIVDNDGNPFIQGSGAYVDKSQRVIIGAVTIGRTEIGGGSDGIEAYHYERSISFSQDKFSDIQIMFQTSDLGYASVVNCILRDVRIKQNKVAKKYRV